MESENEKQIMEILDSIPDKFKVMEKGINMTIQKEYIEFLDQVSYEDLGEPLINEECKKIILNSNDIIEKKKAIVKLGFVGTIDSYKVLEKMYNVSSENLKDWILLAIMENIMSLENELNEESIGMISSGMGGKDNKLRMYFAVVSRNSEAFTKSQQGIIKNEYEVICKENHTDIEKIGFNLDYAELVILLPMYVALDTIVTGGLKRCNEFGNFIAEEYYATNIEIPTEDELPKIIIEHLRSEQ